MASYATFRCRPMSLPSLVYVTNICRRALPVPSEMAPLRGLVIYDYCQATNCFNEVSRRQPELAGSSNNMCRRLAHVPTAHGDMVKARPLLGICVWEHVCCFCEWGFRKPSMAVTCRQLVRLYSAEIWTRLAQFFAPCVECESYVDYTKSHIHSRVVKLYAFMHMK